MNNLNEQTYILRVINKLSEIYRARTAIKLYPIEY